MLVRTLLLASLAFTAGSAMAQGSTQAIVVQASVMSRTSVKVQDAPAQLLVSEHDIARGYVEAQQPLTLAIHSNVSSGVLLQFLCAGEVATQAVVDGQGSMLALAWHREPRQLSLRVKFLLAADARPGSYPWPLRISAAT